MKRKLKRVYELIAEVKTDLPLDLVQRQDDFRLDNGGLLQRISETDCTYVIEPDFEEFDTEYENLTASDLDEIIRILEDVSVEQYKAMKRASN